MKQSRKNIKRDSEGPQEIDFSGGDIASPSEQALEAVQRELEAERDARREERFVWLCITIIIFDMFAFKDMETWSGPVMVGLIQLIFIVALGRKWGMDHIWTITERIIEKWDGKIGK